VRERVARPAMGPCADPYVPFLATLLAFLLGCNLTGLVPLPSLFALIGGQETPVGGTATGSLYVCGALAGMTLVILLASGYWMGVKTLWKGECQDAHASGRHGSPAEGNLVTASSDETTFRRRWPLPVALVLGVPVWLNAFVPPMPGLMGIVLWPFLLVLEVFSLVSRMFALCIRLFANMTAGHLLLFVVIGFAGAGRGWSLAYISIPSGLAAMILMGMELFVSVLQAYIFTFLTAIFIGMVVNPQH